MKDIMECDGCRKKVPSEDTQTCVGHHYYRSSRMEEYLRNRGVKTESLCRFDDLFFCKTCLNPHGFCAGCAAIIPDECQSEEFVTKLGFQVC
jgi:hypothetical protein